MSTLYKTKGVNIAGYKYMVYIFVKGVFVNRGDGGYLNWAFYGRYSRNGG